MNVDTTRNVAHYENANAYRSPLIAPSTNPETLPLPLQPPHLLSPSLAIQQLVQLLPPPSLYSVYALHCSPALGATFVIPPPTRDQPVYTYQSRVTATGAGATA